ncbi:MAG: YjgP/YjgQ family permease [Ignavibacteria bacterium]|nr:YjgP/YjgQ family permease [Ignavibacteria bacterium]
MLISLYILRLHIGPFFFGTFTVMFLFLLQFLMNNLDKLIGKGLDNAIILQVIMLSLSWMIVLAIPMGVLFSTLMAFGSMSGAHETTIIKSGGRSLWRMMMPIIFIGCGLFYGVYWFNDTILPESNHRFKILMQDIQRKKPTFAIESGRFVSQLEGYTILARKVDTASGAMYGVTIYDNGFSTRTNVLSADTGSIKFSSDYARVIVTLHNGEVHQLQKQKRTDFRIMRFAKHVISIAARDFLFQQSDVNLGSRGDREMSIADMRAIVFETDASINVTQKRIDTLMQDHYAEVMQARIAGDSSGLTDVLQKPSKPNDIDIQKRVMNRLSMLRSPLESDLFQASEQQKKKKVYLVEIYKKYSIPCACLVFVFIGCPLGMMSKRGNFGISAAISLIFYVIFWACLIGGEKLADRDLISAEVGGWFGIYVTGFIGLALTFIMNNEWSIKDIWLRFKH